MPAERIAVPGATLHVEVEGQGSPVVLIHGFALDARMWSGVVPRIAKSRLVIAYDVRGFGRSTVPTDEPYTHRADLVALLDAKGVERVDVVGHSVGAHQALEFALQFPTRVRSLALVAPSALGGIPFPEDVSRAFTEIKQAAWEEGVAAAKAIWRRVGWFTEAVAEPRIARELDAIIDAYSAFHWLRSNPFIPLEPPPAERLGEIDVPTLVAIGERDLPYNHAVAARLVDGVRGARRVDLPGLGHMAPMEAPATVSEMLERFLHAVDGG